MELDESGRRRRRTGGGGEGLERGIIRGERMEGGKRERKEG